MVAIVGCCILIHYYCRSNGLSPNLGGIYVHSLQITRLSFLTLRVRDNTLVENQYHGERTLPYFPFPSGIK